MVDVVKKETGKKKTLNFKDIFPRLFEIDGEDG